MNDTTPPAPARRAGAGTHARHAAERRRSTRRRQRAARGAMAHDLAGFAPGAATLELVTVGAHYDAVEVLRPAGRCIANSNSSPRARQCRGARVIAFGAHDDRLPGALAPRPITRAGRCVWCPSCSAAMTDASRARRRCLRTRVDGTRHGGRCDGVGGAGGVRPARSNTRATSPLHDLAAMMALQYEHAGLAPLWPVLESRAAGARCRGMDRSGTRTGGAYTEGEARIALFTPQAWRRGTRPRAAHDSRGVRASNAPSSSSRRASGGSPRCCRRTASR